MSEKDKKSDKGKPEDSIYVAGINTSFLNDSVVNSQSATDLSISDMNNFLEMWERVKNKPPELRRGNLFETVIAAKENSDKALQGISEKTIVTHLDGRHTAPADIETYSVAGKMVSEGQAKFSVMGHKEITNRIIDHKYSGMDIYVPSNKISGVKRELLRRIEMSDEPTEVFALKDTLKHLKRHNTSTVEIISADKDPQKYATDYKFSIFCKNELVASTAMAAVCGGIINGVCSSYKNYNMMACGELKSEEMISSVVKDTAKGAAKSAVIGGTSSVIRYGLSNTGLNTANASNISTGAAVCLYNITNTVYDFARGKIDDEEAIMRIGKDGAGFIGGAYFGAAVGFTVGGPVGAIVGSFIGYAVTSQVYQASMVILEEAKLAEDEAKIVMELCEAAVSQMIKSRIEFESLFQERFKEQQAQYNRYLQSIDDGLESGDYIYTTEVLSQFAQQFGKELKLVQFKEFDEFMVRSNDPLVL